VARGRVPVAHGAGAPRAHGLRRFLDERRRRAQILPHPDRSALGEGVQGRGYPGGHWRPYRYDRQGPQVSPFRGCRTSGTEEPQTPDTCRRRGGSPDRREPPEGRKKPLPRLLEPGSLRMPPSRRCASHRPLRALMEETGGMVLSTVCDIPKGAARASRDEASGSRATPDPGRESTISWGFTRSGRPRRHASGGRGAPGSRRRRGRASRDRRA